MAIKSRVITASKGFTYLGIPPVAGYVDGDSVYYQADASGVFVKAMGAWQRVSGGSGASYGFIGGYNTGGGGASTNSSVDKLMFPFDSGTMSVVGLLSRSLYGGASVNSSVHGFITTGLNGGGTAQTITDRIAFPFDSGTSTVVENITNSRYYATGFNNSIYGYIACGSMPSGAPTSTVMRMDFPFNVGSGCTYQTNSMSVAQCAGFNSSTYGFTLGGTDNGGTNVSTIQRFSFPTLGTVINAGILTTTRRNIQCSGFNSSLYGFVAGGYDNTDYRSYIDRITFPFASGTSSAVGKMSTSKSNTMCFNSTQHGYMVGSSGLSPTGVDRLTFPFDSGTSSLMGYTSGTRYLGGATDGTDFVTQFI